MQLMPKIMIENVNCGTAREGTFALSCARVAIPKKITSFDPVVPTRYSSHERSCIE